MNYLKENLEVILITYNREDALKHTLESCFNNNSPIKDISFTIIDNCSDDNTQTICEEYSKNFSNIKYIKNNINIGGNANICRAMELAQKKYVWFLCDDDYYDWSNWEEIENALKKDTFDAILTRILKKTTQENLDTFFNNSSFFPAVIYKSDNITPTVLVNAYDNIKNMFPHLALSSKIINENKQIFVPKQSIIVTGKSTGIETYRRGVVSKKLPESKLFMLWGVGFLNSTELIMDKKTREIHIDNVCHHINTIFDSLYTLLLHTLFLNYLACDNYKFNKYQLKRLLSTRQKAIFYAANLFVKLRTLFVDKSLYTPFTTNIDWQKYFKKINQQKHINKLAKKYKNKRILIYGAGIIFNTINDEYDLSKLNIVGISDSRFTSETGTFKDFKAIPVSEINNNDFDVILFTLYRNKEIEQRFKSKGIILKSESLIKHSLKILWTL